jgi:RNA polymerase sigma factor (sigma-70 family)
MPFPTRGGLLAFLLRAAPPDPDADAALLERFVRCRDEAAFTELVRRHGPMVFGVCRRRLGDGPDAEDAFQAVFLALARQAGRVRESLPGYLYRVAYLVALKAAGRRRGPAAALAPEEVAVPDPTPDAAAQAAELRAALDAEIAALPDKLRAVVVLCLLEGRTNADAAARLGVPKGTIDSRLSAARKKLQARLLRRGAAAAIFLMDRLTDPPALAAFDRLAARAVAVALAAELGPEFDPITSLVNGVPTMTTTTRKVLTAAALALGLAAGTGFGVYQVAARPAGPPGDEAQKADAKKPGGKKPDAGALVADAAPAGKTAATTAVLSEPAGFPEPLKEVTIRELFEQLSKLHDVTFRLDVGQLRRIGVAGGTNPYDTKVDIDVVKGLSVRDVLQEVIDQLTPAADSVRLGIHVRRQQVIITQAFTPATAPGSYKTAGGEFQKFVDDKEIVNTLYGPTVSVAVEQKPLAEVVAQLRESTGANIVVDSRVREKFAGPVTLTANDARLMTVLKIAGDMCDVAPAVVDNVYYLTSKDNAERLTKETERNLFGEPQVPIPAGYLTDGVRLYEKPAGLKPVDPGKLGLGGLGLGGGGLGGLGVPTKVPESMVKPPAPEKQ